MNDMQSSDSELIDAFRKGNQDAFEELYNRYRKPLYAYLNKMMNGQTSTVDDIFQTTWIKVIDKLDRYEDRQTFFAWIVRIGRNSAIDHFRRNGKQSSANIDEMPLAASGGIPWEEVEAGERAAAIDAAVQKLPAEQLEVFALRQNHVPFKEIAEIQQCSLNTVLGRMHYAVKKLRDILIDWR